MSNIVLKYLTQPPKKWTFEQLKQRSWVESYCRGRVLNLFAGKTRLSVNEYRVDISSDYAPDSCGDALEFLSDTDMIFDTVLLDPPYNYRKAKDKYNGRFIGSLPKIKNAINRILVDDGRVISLGYDTVGMGNKRGYKKIAVCVVCHGGDHKDTLIVVEERIRKDLL